MSQGRWLYRQLVWLALVGFVFGGFEPTVARTTTSSGSAQLAAICGVLGDRPVASQSSGAKPMPYAGSGEDTCCRYCLLLHHATVLPSSTAVRTPAGIVRVSLSAGEFRRNAQTRVRRYAHCCRAPPTPSSSLSA